MGLEVALDNAVGFDVRNVAEEGEAECVFDVVLALDGVVEVINEEREADADEDPAEHPEEDGEDDLGFYRGGGHGSGVDENDVVRGETAEEFGFVAAQEDVAVNGFVVFG